MFVKQIDQEEDKDDTNQTCCKQAFEAHLHKGWRSMESRLLRL